MTSAMQPFSILQPRDLTFGRGVREQAVKKIADLGSRVLLVRGRSGRSSDHLAHKLRAAGLEVVDLPCTREPQLEDVDGGVAEARRHRSDVVVGIGGGSVIDLAKAVAALTPAAHPTSEYLEGQDGPRALDARPLPFVAIPTTSGTGAEVTRNAVIALPAQGKKVSLRSNAMIADVALIDPALTDGTPPDVTFGSGLDALVQVIEPYLSHRATPYTDALCRVAIPMALAALSRLAAGEDPDALDDMALVSLFGGLALTNACLGAVHGLAGVMGGRFGAPHGVLCGRLLCATLQVNHEACRAEGLSVERFDHVLEWFETVLPKGSTDPLTDFAALLEDWPLPQLDLLKELPKDRAAKIAEEALASSSMAANPVRLDLMQVMRILELA